MKHFATTITALCCMTAAQAQTSFSGTVNDKTAAVPDATVSLLRTADSSWVQSQLTDSLGHFAFKDLQDKKYILNVRATGYEELKALYEGQPAITLSLQRNSTALREIVVQSKAPVIQSGMGKTTVNFEQATISAGSNVLELLRRAPGVTVDGNGNISMNGKGVLVMIGDKQTYLSGEDLVHYLKSLPAEQVAQLELMSQPSAKYDAEGNTGIINIKMRRNRKTGLNGNATLAAGLGVYPTTHNTANLSYGGDKLSAYANAGYMRATGFLDQSMERSASDPASGALLSSARQHGFLKETFDDASVKVGADYKANEKLDLGGSLQGIYHTNTETDRTNAYLYDAVAGTEIYNRSVNERGFIRSNLNASFNAGYKPAKGQEITADFNYLYYDQHDGQDLESSNYDANGQPSGNDLQLRSMFPILREVYVAKADYAGAWGKTNIEAGLKGVFLFNGNGSYYQTPQAGVWVNDTMRTNNYIYKEQIQAAYLSADRSWSPKWQTKLGLRAERTYIDGFQETSGIHFVRDFISLFPTAFVSYKPNEHNTFELNCGRRINRPSYRDLNPFVFYTSQYNYSSGNPELLPEFRNRAELSHNYKNRFISSMSVARVYNCINSVVIYNEVTKAVQETLQNNAQRVNAHFSTSYNRQLFEWWQLNASYDWYYNDYQDNDGHSLGRSNGHSVSVNNQFTFKGGWSLDTFYAFNSGDLQSISERSKPSHWLNASVAKKIWKDTATVKLSLEDPFAFYRYRYATDWNGVQAYTDSKFATQQMSLSFTYNFGKKQDKAAPSQRQGSAEESKRM
jgi:hypothetical protein